MLDEGLGSWPQRRARMAPDDVAIIHDGRQLTYGHVAGRVRALADGLAALGVEHGHRVAYLGPNHPAFAETMFAVCSLGAAFVPLNTRLAAPELAFMLDDAGVEVFVHDHRLDDLVSQVRELVEVDAVVRVGEAGGTDAVAFEHLVEQDGLGTPQRRVTMDDVAMVMYTSGTTGRSKGVVLTHANLTWNCFNVLIDVDVSSDEVTLVNAPMFHTAALNQTFLPTFVKGATSVLMSVFEPQAALDIIEQHRVTWMFGVPAMFQALTRAPGWETADMSSVRAVEAGGAPVPEGLIRAYQDRGIVFLQGYGMTEASPGVLFLRAKDSLRKVGSAGTPCFFTDVRVITPDGRAAAPGEPGEIHVQGPNVMQGYWRLSEETDAVLDEEGWFRSGDVAVADDEGYLTIVDRIKDMFITGGENVYPAEIENVLHEHPEVADCAVIGVPDDRWGEVGHAVVVLREHGQLTQEEMSVFLEDRLARYKIPKSLEVVEALPRNASGKLLKKRLLRGDVEAGTTERG